MPIPKGMNQHEDSGKAGPLVWFKRREQWKTGESESKAGLLDKACPRDKLRCLDLKPLKRKEKKRRGHKVRF